MTLPVIVALIVALAVIVVAIMCCYKKCQDTTEGDYDVAHAEKVTNNKHQPLAKPFTSAL